MTTPARSSNWLRARSAVAAGVVAVGLAGACGVPTDDGATLVDDADVPFGLLDPPTTTTSAPAPTPTVPTRAGQLCFVREGTLVPVVRELPLAADLQEVTRELVRGPSAAEVEGGLRSAIVGPELVGSAVLSGGVARVDLGTGFGSVAGIEQLLALGQLVCTLTAQPGVGQVAFTLAGQPVEVPRGDGSLTSDPVSRDDYGPLMTPAADTTTTTA